MRVAAACTSCPARPDEDPCACVLFAATRRVTGIARTTIFAAEGGSAPAREQAGTARGRFPRSSHPDAVSEMRDAHMTNGDGCLARLRRRSSWRWRKYSRAVLCQVMRRRWLYHTSDGPGFGPMICCWQRRATTRCPWGPRTQTVGRSARRVCLWPDSDPTTTCRWEADRVCMCVQ